MSKSRVIRVAPTGSKASPNVRYAFNGDQIRASQRTDAKCQEETLRPPYTAVMPAAEAVLRGLSRKIALRPVHPFAASACSAVHRSKLGIKARDLISQIDWLAPSVVAAAAHGG